jgi:uncharacterized protein (TIGR00369 family)
VKKKSISESRIETRYLVMPEHTNHYGTAFGGVILSWIDIAAAMVAEKHCGHEAVTVSIDNVAFLFPVFSGDHVVLKAELNYVGRTSMEIQVEVYKESIKDNKRIKTTTAFLTFIGLDKKKKPQKVPEIILFGEDEKRRFEEAKERVRKRKLNIC